MSILYKVVRKHSRTSVYAGGKYEKMYNKGDIVKAPVGTVGLFCFNDEDIAMAFAVSNSTYDTTCVIKVEAEEESLCKDTICSFLQNEEGLDRFYKFIQSNQEIPDWIVMPAVPSGTVLCKEVLVLE